MKRKLQRTTRLGCLSLALAISMGLMYGMPLTAKAVDYEAKIGEVYYEELEEAFANVKTGETIIVLKDCSVSKTLEIAAEDVTLKSEDGSQPATIDREEDFIGQSYAQDADNVLLGISSGSLVTQDIILDGGAVLDSSFQNSGKAWDSPLVYVKGNYTMEEGTVLKNNYNTDGSEGKEGSPRGTRTAGALHVAQDGSLIMNGGLIQDCYTLGSGGGIQSESSLGITITSGTIKHCSGIWGGALGLYGSAIVSGMTLCENSASSTGGAIWSNSSLTLSDCMVRDNKSEYDAGGIHVSADYPVSMTGCTVTGNSAYRGSAIQSSGAEGTQPLMLKDCTITGNRLEAYVINGGAICYMHKAGIILDGSIVMADNLSIGTQPSDISFRYNDAAPILLGEDFVSTSVFVLGGDEILPGKLLVDGVTNGKETNAEQFTWNTEKYRTIEKDGNIYLGEISEIDSPSQGGDNGEDNTGTDYGEEQETDMAEELSIFEKWEAGNEKELSENILQETEPVIQTGRISPIYWLSILGLCSVLIFAFSMAGMAVCRYHAEEQTVKYQDIAETYTQRDFMREEERVRREDGTESYDWDALYRVNSDIKGWLHIPDSLIDFPVTETTDNDFYLNHDFSGNKSSDGCPFMDKDTNIMDFNRVIYGHNMGIGSDAMFSTLLKYEQEDYFRKNQTIYFTEVYGSPAVYQVMAVVKYNTEDIGEWDFRTRNHENMESYNIWMEKLQERALYYLEPDKAPDSILTLATCDRREYGKNGRFLIVAGRSL